MGKGKQMRSSHTIAASDEKLEKISRKLTQLLRHRIHENGLTDVLRPDGYVPLARVLALPQFKEVTEADVRETVRTNDKQRMAIMEEGRTVYIRANQGHTADGIDANALLTPIDADGAKALGEVVHGTYHSAWPSIVDSGGLHRMARHHIHLAKGMPGEQGVISGMRKSSEVYIWVDVAKAVASGIPFFTSQNGVVLTAGRESDGILPLEMFSKVVDARTGRDLLNDLPATSGAAASSSSAPAPPPKLRLGFCRSSTAKQADGIVKTSLDYSVLVKAAAGKLKLARGDVRSLVLMESVNGHPVGTALPEGDCSAYLKDGVLIWVNTEEEDDGLEMPDAKKQKSDESTMSFGETTLAGALPEVS